MRFPRNVKIFRGQVDAAPFGGLFFLLLIFLLLFHTNVFIPGVPIDLGGKPPPPEMPSRTLSVRRDTSLEFEGKTYSFEQFEAELRQRAKSGTLPKRLVFENEPGAPETLTVQAQTLLTELGVLLKDPGNRLELPEDAGFPGVAGESVVVAVNLNGQIFYQQQRIQGSQLQEQLTAAVEHAAGPLTMILQADKKVSFDKLMELMQIARKAGVARVSLAHRPRPLD